MFFFKSTFQSMRKLIDVKDWGSILSFILLDDSLVPTRGSLFMRDQMHFSLSL